MYLHGLDKYVVDTQSSGLAHSFSRGSETHLNHSEWVSLLPNWPPPSTRLRVPKMRKPRLVVMLSNLSMWTNIQQVDLMLERIYANMSACHLKQENWRRAIDTADKVTTTRPEHCGSDNQDDPGNRKEPGQLQSTLPQRQGVRRIRIF